MKKSGEIALKTDVGKLDLARLPKEVTEIKDVSYIDDNDPAHKMDIYLRKDGSKKPILIDIHGGGFISEDKAMNRLFGNYMAKLFSNLTSDWHIPSGQFSIRSKISIKVSDLR